MKTKIIIITESLLLVGCIIGIIYFLQINNSLRTELATVNSEIQSLHTQLSEKDSALSDATNKLSELDITITDLESVNRDLESKISELEIVIDDSKQQVELLQMEVEQKVEQPKQSTQQQQQQPKPESESETSTQQPIPNDLSFDEIDALLGITNDGPRLDEIPKAVEYGGDGVVSPAE